MTCDHAVTAAAVVAVLPVPKQAVCGRRCSPRSAGAARGSGTAWEVSSWTTNTWACAATSGAATRGAAGGQGEEDDREVRRTGDRVHCAADSATYGRVALTRQRGQGIRENPHPMRCLLMLRRRPVAAKGAAQLALCGSAAAVTAWSHVMLLPPALWCCACPCGAAPGRDCTRRGLCG